MDLKKRIIGDGHVEKAKQRPPRTVPPKKESQVEPKSESKVLKKSAD